VTARTVRGSNLGRGKRLFSFPKYPNRLWGPPSLIFCGYRGCIPGVKRPEREIDRSSPSSAEVNNTPSWLGQGKIYRLYPMKYIMQVKE